MSDLTAICSQCGYDLRGIASARCPECGYELARQNALTGEIPWTYRRSRGRARAFVETVGKVTVGGDWIGRVVAGPVSLRDARRFWLVAATLASLPLVGAVVTTMALADDRRVPMLMPSPFGSNAIFGGTPTWLDSVPEWLRWNVLYPAAAGLTVPGVAIVAAWLFTLLASGVHTYAFHPVAIGPTRRQRANAFSYYLAAPLVVAAVPMAAACFFAGRAVVDSRFRWSRYSIAAALAAIVLLLVMGLWYARIVTALRRTTHCGLGRATIVALCLPVAWLACGGVALLAFPWAAGLAWIWLDALR